MAVRPVVAPTAFIGYANHITLPPGTEVGPMRVQSRMLLWCRGGEGSVTVNGEARRLQRGHFLILPWMHEIHYLSDTDEGWKLAGIHIIPALLPSGSTKPDICHIHLRHDKTSQGLPGRADIKIPALEGVVAGSFAQANELEILASYIVEWYKREPGEAEANWLAQTLLNELVKAAQTHEPDIQAMPGAVRRMLELAEARLAKPLFIADLARAGKCSSATANRLFRQWLGKTPVQWIREKRLELAASLLAETDMPMSEVARRSGFTDVFYFSRLFHKMRGMTASEYRQRARLL